MIRFIDIRKQDTGYKFAFFNTCTAKFVTINNEQAWFCAEDFEKDYYNATERDNDSLTRFLELCPLWVYKLKGKR